MDCFRNEKREFKRNIRSYISEFSLLRTMDEKETRFKEILDYLLTKPMLLIRMQRFYETVLKTIRKNQLTRHHKISGFYLNENEVDNWNIIGNTPFIDYNYYYQLFINL